MMRLPAIRFSALLCYVIMAITSFSACSKKDDESPDLSKDYHFSASFDGRKVNLRVVKFQGGGNDNRWEQIVIGGNETSDVKSPSLDFEIWRLGGNISAGKYVTTSEPEMVVRYAIQQADGTMVYNTTNFDDVVTVNIETISKEGIKGTLSGTIRNMAGQAISITDGSFNLPYNILVNP